MLLRVHVAAQFIYRDINVDIFGKCYGIKICKLIILRINLTSNLAGQGTL